MATRQRAVVCPGCSKRGVTFRMKTQADSMTCRYCGWSYFTQPADSIDRIRKMQLIAANPGAYNGQHVMVDAQDLVVVMRRYNVMRAALVYAVSAHLVAACADPEYEDSINGGDLVDEMREVATKLCEGLGVEPKGLAGRLSKHGASELAE